MVNQMEQYFWQKTQKNSSPDKCSTDMWKLFLRCSNQLKILLYLKFWKITKKNDLFKSLFFNKMIVNKSKIVINFFMEKEREAPECSANSPDQNPTKNLWAFLKQRLRRTIIGVDWFSAVLVQYWNTLDSDSLRLFWWEFFKSINS